MLLNLVKPPQSTSPIQATFLFLLPERTQEHLSPPQGVILVGSLVVVEPQKRRIDQVVQVDSVDLRVGQFCSVGV